MSVEVLAFGCSVEPRMKGRYRTHGGNGADHCDGVSSSFCTTSLRSPGRRKGVQTFRSHRLRLAPPPPAKGLATRSRTQVHDCIRRRFSWHEVLPDWSLFSSFRQKPAFCGTCPPFLPTEHGKRSTKPPSQSEAENLTFFNDSIRSRCEHRYC